MTPSARVSSAAICLLFASVAGAADCLRTSTAGTPLDEPWALLRFEGSQGGLYPNRSNVRPAGHQAAGMRLAGEVRPRNAQGSADDAGGRIVFLSIGMSNTTQEFSVFQRLARDDRDRNPAVVSVDGAQGGMSVERILADPQPYFNTVQQRLTAEGVTAAQVQTAWVKQANAEPRLPFPDDARKLQADLRALVNLLRDRFPNLKLIYLSSRIYAGYASTTLNPEPYAWQSGFAVKSLIEERIGSDAAPWLSWGPYLWANGTTPREDGLTWACEEFEADGTHPSNAGALKVARMLLDFLHSDSTARVWYRRRAAPGAAPVIERVRNAASGGEAVATASIATIYGRNLGRATQVAGSLPLPTSMEGTVVTLGGRPLPLYFVSPTQINFAVSGEPSGDQLAVTTDAGTSAPVTLQAGFTAPGIFTLDSQPTGPAAAMHADFSVVTPQAPARAGEVLLLFVTGRGLRNPLIAAPEFAPVVRVGETAAEVLFFGAAPGFPGLQQANFRVPAGQPAGDARVRLEFGPSVSNAASLPVR